MTFRGFPRMEHHPLEINGGVTTNHLGEAFGKRAATIQHLADALKQAAAPQAPQAPTQAPSTAPQKQK